MAGKVIGHVSFRIRERDEDAPGEKPVRITCEICGEAGQGRAADQFVKFKLIVLYEKM